MCLQPAKKENLIVVMYQEKSNNCHFNFGHALERCLSIWRILIQMLFFRKQLCALLCIPWNTDFHTDLYPEFIIQIDYLNSSERWRGPSGYGQWWRKGKAQDWCFTWYLIIFDADLCCYSVLAQCDARLCSEAAPVWNGCTRPWRIRPFSLLEAALVHWGEGLKVNYLWNVAFSPIALSLSNDKPDLVVLWFAQVSSLCLPSAGGAKEFPSLPSLSAPSVKVCTQNLQLSFSFSPPIQEILEWCYTSKVEQWCAEGFFNQASWKVTVAPLWIWEFLLF